MTRFGLAAPQRLRDGPSPAAALAEVARWERDHPELDGLWLADRATGDTGHLDPIAWASAIAGATARLRIGTAVLVAPLRHPLTTAHQAASIDQVSGGRFTLGLGSGSDRARQLGGWPATGWTADMDAYVDAVQRLTSGLLTTSHGAGWVMTGEQISPLPAQTPLPIWLSGHSGPALRRAARIGAGWIGSGLVGTDRCVTDLSILRELVAGRPPTATFTTAKRVYVHLPDAGPPRLRTHDEWSQIVFGSPSFADAFLVRGSVDDCAAGIAPLVAAGIDAVILDPVNHHPDHVDAVLGDLIPRLAAVGG